MKLETHKTHIYCFILTSINLVFHETVFSLLLAIPQIILIFYLIVSQKDYDKVVYFHVMFLFTTLAVPYSQLTNPGDAGAGLFNYSRLKLIGPLAVSQFLMVTILMYGVIKSPRMRVLKEQKPIISLIFYFFITGIILSGFGLAFNDYSYQKFLTYIVYISVLVLTAVMICLIKNHEDIVKLVYSLLLMAPIASVVVYLMGVSTSYGSSEIPGMTEVAYFSPILIYKCFSQRKTSLIEVISIICCLYLATTGATGGKGIVVIFLVMILTAASKMSVKTIGYVFVLCGASILGSTFITYEQIHNYNGLLLYKLESVRMLLTFIFDFDMGIINILPMSPRVRVIELYLILQQNSTNLVYLLFGQGFGGWYEDSVGYFAGIDLKSAFSPEELDKSRYHSSHDFFTTIPFFHGIVGTVFMGYVSFYYVTKIRNNYLYLSILPFLLSIYFNNQFGAFAIVALLTASMSTNMSTQLIGQGQRKE